jgi:hypothetical protein
MKFTVQPLRQLAFALSFFTFTGMGLAHSAFALSPPWYVLEAQIRATLQGDPDVLVEDLKTNSEGYTLDVEVRQNSKKAEALATFVSRVHTYGQVKLTVEVVNDDGKIVSPAPLPTDENQLRSFIWTALHDNAYFVRVDSGNGIYRLFIEFAPEIIQYFADNVADYYRKINQVAADAFAEVLNLRTDLNLKIGTSTSPCDSPHNPSEMFNTGP